MNKTIPILLTISVALAIALSLLYMQNMQLKEQVNELNKEYERGAIEGVNDFTLFVISKVKVCQAVTLMANKTSATVIDVACK